LTGKEACKPALKMAVKERSRVSTLDIIEDEVSLYNTPSLYDFFSGWIEERGFYHSSCIAWRIFFCGVK
jgi:hypothetical protein